jgi:dihydroneopterin aldolase
MNDWHKNVELWVGIEDYRFLLDKPCLRDHNRRVSLRLSFELCGKFLEAAHSDAIQDTVDYQAMCQAIEERLKDADCGIMTSIAHGINDAIASFSPLITGGYVRLEIRCHDTFTSERRLL